MQTLPLNDSSWQSLGTGLSAAIIQASTPHVVMAIQTAQPGVNDFGYKLPEDIPVSPPNVADFGGTIWVRSLFGTSTVTYNAA